MTMNSVQPGSKSDADAATAQSAAAFILRRSRVIGGTLYACDGDRVYEFMRYDYGCASEDTRIFNEPHKSVTLRPDGDYPFFTVPTSDLLPDDGAGNGTASTTDDSRAPGMNPNTTEPTDDA